MSNGQNGSRSIQALYELGDIFTILTEGLETSRAKAAEHKGSALLSSVHGCAVNSHRAALDILSVWQRQAVKFVEMPVEITQSALPVSLCTVTLSQKVKDGVLKPSAL